MSKPMRVLDGDREVAVLEPHETARQVIELLLQHYRILLNTRDAARLTFDIGPTGLSHALSYQEKRAGAQARAKRTN